MAFQPDVGGVPRYVASLVRALRQRGWVVSVAAPPRCSVAAELAAHSDHVLALDTANVPSPRDLVAARDLVRFTRRATPDLIHAHSSKAGLLAAVAGRLTGVATVYSPHGWSFERDVSLWARRLYIGVERTLARSHACVVAVADYEREVALRARVVPPERVRTIRTGLEEVPLPPRAEARAALHLDSDEYVVGWIGRLGPQKGADLLPALAQAAGPGVRLIALGYGMPGSTVGARLSALGGRVVENVDAADVYAAADVIVVPSRWEGLPIVVLEAMRAWRPVVAFDVGGIREQVLHRETGRLVAPGDVAGLADALRALGNEPSLREQLGRGARNRFEREFAFDGMVDAVEEVYHGALRARPETESLP